MSIFYDYVSAVPEEKYADFDRRAADILKRLRARWWNETGATYHRGCEGRDDGWYSPEVDRWIDEDWWRRKAGIDKLETHPLNVDLEVLLATDYERALPALHAQADSLLKYIKKVGHYHYEMYDFALLQMIYPEHEAARIALDSHDSQFGTPEYEEILMDRVCAGLPLIKDRDVALFREVAEKQIREVIATGNMPAWDFDAFVALFHKQMRDFVAKETLRKLRTFVILKLKKYDPSAEKSVHPLHFLQFAAALEIREIPDFIASSRACLKAMSNKRRGFMNPLEDAALLWSIVRRDENALAIAARALSVRWDHTNSRVDYGLDTEFEYEDLGVDHRFGISISSANEAGAIAWSRCRPQCVELLRNIDDGGR